ncbi:MAG: SDR family oxidoreductase [Cyclobacteriaceae bacterium]|jgi:NAD(P)-dependent dehydrogenase (short-subunit alcohol dehydrogenase family)|nr:SDR family oxidoreductase [Cyclobacteriaceae bacterium]MDH4297339.1 SDR family oxidoreductase [Cyclobacteriaceae bacterium]MDH5250960.1 SDR family oxidoreductase [Cyclobacteriaceae bacterium]
MLNTWLHEKSIVIIGGTTGIGLTAAQAFVEHGARVVAVGRNPESVDKASSTLKENGVAMVGNAEQPETAINAITLCLKKFGAFHGLYHVAGGSGRKFGDGPLHEMTLAGWNQTLSLNLTSLMLSNQAAIKAFLDQKTSGTILNMGSVLGFSPSPNYFVTHAYAATKSAVIGFSKAIASYYAASNIRINVLAPALVETPMAKRAAADESIMHFIKTKQPLDGGRIGLPADLNGAAVYFMSDYSSFTTGQVLSVDGGWSISEGQY